jgi:hypothetical protein
MQSERKGELSLDDHLKWAMRMQRLRDIQTYLCEIEYRMHLLRDAEEFEKDLPLVRALARRIKASIAALEERSPLV